MKQKHCYPTMNKNIAILRHCDTRRYC